MSTIRSDHRHRFAAPVDELWTAITDSAGYRGWWPWLRRLDGADFVEGATWRCEVQPPLPYVLRFRLHLEEVEPTRFVTASVDGDIAGSAALDLRPLEGGGSELRLVAALAPSSPALRTVARVASPIARFGHDWVLETGLRQFRRRALGEG